MAATHQRCLEVIHLAFEGFSLRGLSFHTRGFLATRICVLRLRRFCGLFVVLHLLTSCPFVDLARRIMEFEAATIMGVPLTV